MNDMNPRRHPRTLAEAFGPYTSRRIDEPRDTWRWAVPVYAAALVAAVFFYLALAARWGL